MIDCDRTAASLLDRKRGLMDLLVRVKKGQMKRSHLPSAPQTAPVQGCSINLDWSCWLEKQPDKERISNHGGTVTRGVKPVREHTVPWLAFSPSPGEVPGC